MQLWKNFRTEIRNWPAARKGTVWGAIGAAAGASLVAGADLRSGLGLWADILLCLMFVALALVVGAVAIGTTLWMLEKLPRFATGVVLGAMAIVALLWPWPPSLGPRMGIVIGLIECTLGAATAVLLSGRLRNAGPARRIITIALCVLTLAGNIGLFAFFHSDGTDPGSIGENRGAPSTSPAGVQSPASPGPYAVRTLFYGSGTDRRRPEYGTSVAVKTPAVDASSFLSGLTGLSKKRRRAFWGFDVDSLPLNGRVWYPAGEGPFPLVLVVHGNHRMEEFSDSGFAYLGELLASRGFILVSVDENFLNSTETRLLHDWDDLDNNVPARAWLLLEHLKLWRSWSADPKNPFYAKVDLQNIALIGHSRGGEAVAAASAFNRLSHYPEDATVLFDYQFQIKSIVTLAPVDEFELAGKSPVLENLNYLTLQGDLDSDVGAFAGSRQWERVRFTDGHPRFKAEIYIHGANHGQFNTVWGRADDDAPGSWLLNLKPLISGEDQRQITKVYVSAFLESTLHGRQEYIPIFRDHRWAGSWLPDTPYLTRFQDSSFRVLCNFEEDVDVTTATVPGGRLDGERLTVWREQRIPLREGNREHNGVYLGWDRAEHKNAAAEPATYSIFLPEGINHQWKIGRDSVLQFSIASAGRAAAKPGEPTDFTVELQTSNGALARLPLSQFGILRSPLRVPLFKLSWMDADAFGPPVEPIFQTYELPLMSFAASVPDFDPARLNVIRLRFDRSPAGVIVLSQAGLSKLASP